MDILGGIIVVGALFVLTIALVTRITVSNQYIKCPNCGEEMEFEGNVGNNGVVYRDTKHPAYKHLYRCPHCGMTKVI